MQAHSLTSGNTKSCGCYRIDRGEVLGTASRKHGESYGRKVTTEYRIWSGMVLRCTQPRHPAWKDYGGRGIAVCARWQGTHGYEHFLADMGRRPDNRTLDRKDNDGPYSPDNCHWATAREQNTNKRGSTPPVTINGETLLVVEWRERLHISRETYRQRIKAGMTPEQALTTRRKSGPAPGTLKGPTRDIAGQHFGRLVAVHATDVRVRGAVVWHCTCDCGGSTDVPLVRLTTGLTKSCGCLRREMAKTRGFQKHVVVE